MSDGSLSVENEESEAISMFFDKEFVPHAYLDALFNTTLKGTSHSKPTISSQLTSTKNLKLLQSKCTSLLAHLDYYTNELSRDLSNKIENLKNSSSIISYSYENAGFNSDLELTGTTRLEYYTDMLKNSIHTLYNEVQSVDSKILNLKKDEVSNIDSDEVSEGNEATLKSDKPSRDAIENLIKLKKIRANVIQVLRIFETAKVICHSDPSVSHVSKASSGKQAPTGSKSNDEYTVVTQTSFSNSLNILQDTIVSQLRSGADNDLLSKIDSLVELLPVFKNFSNFYTLYNKFINRIVHEKETYVGKKG